MNSKPICLLLLVFIVLSAGRATAQTNVGGTFFSQQHWTLAGSPYTVTTDVQMAPNYTLTIDPGVTVRFSGNTEILIKGGIHAVGTATDPITFEGSGADNILHFMDADFSASEMRYCNLSGGNKAFSVDGACYGTGSFRDLTISFATIQSWDGPTGEFRISQSNLDSVTLRGVHQVSGTNNMLVLDSCHLHNCKLEGNSTMGTPKSLVVRNSNLDHCATQVGMIYGDCLLLEGDSLENCVFHSNYGKGYFEGCYLHDCEFSNFGVTQQNQYYYDLTNCVVVNTDFVGGLLGHQWYMSIKFDHCLIEKTATTLMAIDHAEFVNSSVIGDGLGTGVLATFFTAHQSLFKFHEVGIHFNNTFPNPAMYITECNVWGNSLYNVICDSTYGADANGTWWGTADSLTIFTKIRDYYDNLLDGEIVLGTWATAPDTNAPMSPPSGLQDTPGSGFHTLSWNANSEADLDGYRLYLGTVTGYRFTQSIDLGNVTSYVIPDSLYQMGFAITAYDRVWDGLHDIAEGHESSFSRLGGPMNAVEPTGQQPAIDVLVYPNPARDLVHVVTKEHLPGLSLTLYDLQGRKLLTQQGQLGETVLDVDGLPAGMYLLQASAKGRSISRRIVVE